MSGAEAGGTRETVLVVDDNADARRAMVRTLEWHGYQTLQTGDPGEASALVGDSDPRVDLLVTDVVMPSQSGISLAREAFRTRPDLRVLFVSGFADGEVHVDDLPRDVCGFLEKPMTIDQLARKVREVLDAPRPDVEP